MDYPEIIAYLNDDCTPQEKEAVEQWRSANADNERMFNNIRQVWEASIQKVESENPDIGQAWKQVRSQTTGKQIKKINWSRRISGIAAVLLLGLVAYLSQPWWIPVKMEEVITQNEGIPTQVSLPDGSSVWLNKHSKLVFPKKFKGRERVVELSGEAFFDVQRNESKPFSIKTAEAQVKVLGTSFDVMAYPDSSIVRVQVNSGRVALSSIEAEQDSLILSKGEEGFYEKNERRLEKANILQANRIAWKTRILEFNNTSIAEAIPLIQDIYQVRLELANIDIGNCRFSATFDDEPLENILETMSTLFEIKTAQKQSNSYTLSGQGCPK